MPKKITYLLGAGASANALPTVKACGNNSGFSKSLIDLAENLLSDKKIEQHYTYQHTLSLDFKWLAKKSDEYDTVDTFAKYLFIKGDVENLDKLKKTLSIYFAIEQINKLDKRYIIFLTSILAKDQKFPDNIKIISWNYDFQMQNAAEELTVLHCYPNHINSYPPDIKRDYNLIQINGIAGFDFNEKGKPNKLIRKNINSLFEAVTQSENKHLITFAWEKNNDSETFILLEERMKLIQKAINDTHILVIIGYSFPFFNREVDKDIFKILNTVHLEKIYYQDPFRTGEFLKNQFELDIKEEKIIHRSDCQQFFIPNEL